MPSSTGTSSSARRDDPPRRPPVKAVLANADPSSVERTSAADPSVELDLERLSAAAALAVAKAAEEDDPKQALDAAVGALHDAAPGILPSVFVLEHGRLWLVAQRGYAVVPDGIRVDSGVTGRVVRLGRAQLVRDVRSDADYVSALPGVLSELALPLLVGGTVVGVLNVESERGLPADGAEAFGALTAALAPLARTLSTGRTLDLPALARLFVHVGSMRDPDEIAAIAAASLSKIIPLEVSQVVLWDEAARPWSSPPGGRRRSGRLRSRPRRSPARGSDRAHGRVPAPRGGPRGSDASRVAALRANGEEIGALVGSGGPVARVDPVQLDTAAVLAAHVAASLDAAVALRRERESAVTDSLTGVLNRRGLEERLERELAAAKERRVPMSLLVIDCDDLKEINDRAGHEFGDALLREVAGVLTRSLPEGAAAGRLGGDEFVVTLPEAGTDMAEALGERIRSILAEGLTEAGFPSGSAPASRRIRSTARARPRSSGRPTRRSTPRRTPGRTGSRRSATSRSDLRAQKPGKNAGERRRGPPSDASILRDAAAAVEAFHAEATSGGVCNRLCKSLVFVVGATACSASTVDGEYLVDLASHALRDIALGREAAYRIADFPLTAEVLRTAEPRAVSFADGDVDPAEAFILRELNMSALLMLPLRVRGTAWGLVELYEMRLRRFSEEDLAVARFLVGQAERRLDVIATADPPLRRPPVYELPSDASGAGRGRGRRSAWSRRGAGTAPRARRGTPPRRSRTSPLLRRRRPRSRPGGTTGRGRRRGAGRGVVARRLLLAPPRASSASSRWERSASRAARACSRCSTAARFSSTAPSSLRRSARRPPPRGSAPRASSARDARSARSASRASRSADPTRSARSTDVRASRTSSSRRPRSDTALSKRPACSSSSRRRSARSCSSRSSGVVSWWTSLRETAPSQSGSSVARSSSLALVVARARHALSFLGCVDAGGPTLSRRVRSGPPTTRDFAGRAVLLRGPSLQGQDVGRRSR